MEDRLEQKKDFPTKILVAKLGDAFSEGLCRLTNLSAPVMMKDQPARARSQELLTPGLFLTLASRI